MTPTDEELMKAYREGDESAFSELVHRYKTPLFGYLVRMSGDAAFAEDVFQETFLRVHQKCHSFNSGARFKTWLYKIATNRAIDGFRKQKRETSLDILDEAQMPEECDQETPARQAQRSELAEEMKAHIDKLPTQQRNVLQLAYFQGLSYPEVADVLKCSTGTVKTHMSRALQTLGRRLPGLKGGLFS